MPIKYHIDFVENLVEVSFSGRVTGVEIFEGLKNIYSDKMWSQDIPHIWDCSMVSKVDIDFSDVLAYKKLVASVQKEDSYPARSAVVVDNRIVYILVLMLQRVVNITGCASPSRFFSDKRSAISWLHLTPSVGFSSLDDTD